MNEYTYNFSLKKLSLPSLRVSPKVTETKDNLPNLKHFHYEDNCYDVFENRGHDNFRAS